MNSNILMRPLSLSEPGEMDLPPLAGKAEVNITFNTRDRTKTESGGFGNN